MMRRHYIIKPKIQVKYMLIALFVVCLTGASVYYAFWSSMVKSPGLEQLSSGEWMALRSAYQTNFVWVLLILAVGLGLESIFLFHRIVGPIFAFERVISRLTGGRFDVNVHVRKTDELKDVAGEIQGMIDAVRGAVARDRESIAEIDALLDQGKTAEARERLSGVTRWFEIG